MRIEELSSGYYITECYVEPGEEKPQVNDHDYRELQYEVHEAGSDEQYIMFQMDGTFFEVEPATNIPNETLALPEEILELTKVKHPPARRGIMVPKPWMFKFLKEPNIQRSEAL